MSRVTLPLFDEFMEIFEHYEIENWEAKYFWHQMKSNDSSKNIEDRNKMYKGLSILVNLGYLEIDKKNSSKKLYSYTETIHLKKLRKDLRNKKLASFFSIKKSELLNVIKVKENNVKFLNLLYVEKSGFENIINIYIIKIENEISNIKSNIELMGIIENQFKTL